MALSPCPTCQGLGHICKDEDPLAIHQHQDMKPCKKCGGRGLVPADDEAATIEPETEE